MSGDVGRLPPKLRVEAYIANVERAIEKIGEVGDPRVKRVIDLARGYVSDAKYYLDKGDIFTALADIAYAEGLLDALRWLGIVDFEWDSTLKLALRPRVLVAGTFDILHPGHIELLRFAWEKGRVYVVVARDETVEKFKGRPPLIPEEQRLAVVSAVRYVHRAVLGSKRDILEPVLKIRPNVIVLGPDQWADEDWLRRRLEENGLKADIVRLSKRIECPLCSATRIICRAAELGVEICRR